MFDIPSPYHPCRRGPYESHPAIAFAEDWLTCPSPEKVVQVSQLFSSIEFAVANAPMKRRHVFLFNAEFSAPPIIAIGRPVDRVWEAWDHLTAGKEGIDQLFPAPLKEMEGHVAWVAVSPSFTAIVALTPNPSIPTSRLLKGWRRRNNGRSGWINWA